MQPTPLRVERDRADFGRLYHIKCVPDLWVAARLNAGVGRHANSPLKPKPKSNTILPVSRGSLRSERSSDFFDTCMHCPFLKVIGRRHISHFIEDLVRPHVIGTELEAGYRAMAEDEARETEALAWAEATIGDIADAAR